MLQLLRYYEILLDYSSLLFYNILAMSGYYYIFTYGCQMNVHESEKIAGLLREIGYVQSSDCETADVIVFNTCCIRDTAEKKILGNIGDVKHFKKNNPSLIVAVVGCMTQQKGIAESLKNKFPFVNIILGTHNIEELPKLVSDIDNKIIKRQISVSSEDNPEICETMPIYRTSGTNAWVNIMYGCNNFCTYCIVPYVRGRERSRAPETILSEIKNLLANGYKEITLLGQNVDSYSYEGYDFAYLLEKISEIGGKFRVRFMTSHPKDFNGRVIDIIKNSPNICNNIHLPVQSGSNRILGLMNRRYTRERYLEIIDEIYDKIPSAGITSDIMVGFPTETDEDFQDTLSLTERVRFSNAFTFVYSPRNGTVAAGMEQLPYSVKRERIKTLVALQNKISAEKSLDYIDNIEEILVEDVNPKKPGTVCGRTESGRLVTFSGEKALIGKFVNVKIASAKSSALWGVKE